MLNLVTQHLTECASITYGVNRPFHHTCNHTQGTIPTLEFMNTKIANHNTIPTKIHITAQQSLDLNTNTCLSRSWQYQPYHAVKFPTTGLQCKYLYTTVTESPCALSALTTLNHSKKRPLHIYTKQNKYFKRTSPTKDPGEQPTKQFHNAKKPPAIKTYTSISLIVIFNIYNTILYKTHTSQHNAQLKKLTNYQTHSKIVSHSNPKWQHDRLNPQSLRYSNTNRLTPQSHTSQLYLKNPKIRNPSYTHSHVHVEELKHHTRPKLIYTHLELNLYYPTNLLPALKDPQHHNGPPNTLPNYTLFSKIKRTSTTRNFNPVKLTNALIVALPLPATTHPSVHIKPCKHFRNTNTHNKANCINPVTTLPLTLHAALSTQNALFTSLTNYSHNTHLTKSNNTSASLLQINLASRLNPQVGSNDQSNNALIGSPTQSALNLNACHDKPPTRFRVIPAFSKLNSYYQKHNKPKNLKHNHQTYNHNITYRPTISEGSNTSPQSSNKTPTTNLNLQPTHHKFNPLSTQLGHHTSTITNLPNAHKSKTLHTTTNHTDTNLPTLNHEPTLTTPCPTSNSSTHQNTHTKIQQPLTLTRTTSINHHACLSQPTPKPLTLVATQTPLQCKPSPTSKQPCLMEHLNKPTGNLPINAATIQKDTTPILPRGITKFKRHNTSSPKPQSTKDIEFNTISNPTNFPKCKPIVAHHTQVFPGAKTHPRQISNPRAYPPDITTSLPHPTKPLQLHHNLHTPTCKSSRQHLATKCKINLAQSPLSGFHHIPTKPAPHAIPQQLQKERSPCNQLQGIISTKNTLYKILNIVNTLKIKHIHIPVKTTLKTVTPQNPTSTHQNEYPQHAYKTRTPSGALATPERKVGMHPNTNSNKHRKPYKIRPIVNTLKCPGHTRHPSIYKTAYSETLKSSEI
eukprot:gene3058-2040_t